MGEFKKKQKTHNCIVFGLRMIFCLPQIFWLGWVVAAVDSSGRMPAPASRVPRLFHTDTCLGLQLFTNFKVANDIIFRGWQVDNTWYGCNSEWGSKGIAKINSAKNKDRVEANYLPSTSTNGFLQGGEEWLKADIFSGGEGQGRFGGRGGQVGRGACRGGGACPSADQPHRGEDAAVQAGDCSSSVENVFWNGENSSRLEQEGLKSEKLLWYNIAFTPKCQIVPFLLLIQLCHHTITLFEAKLEEDVSGKQGPGGEPKTRESDPWQQEESRFPWGGIGWGGFVKMWK